MKCLCGAEATIGRYCRSCLEKELYDMSPEDIEAAAEKFDSLKEQPK